MSKESIRIELKDLGKNEQWWLRTKWPKRMGHPNYVDPDPIAMSNLCRLFLVLQVRDFEPGLVYFLTHEGERLRAELLKGELNAS